MIKTYVEEMNDWDNMNVFTLGGIIASFINFMVMIALLLCTPQPLWQVSTALLIANMAYWVVPYLTPTSKVLRSNSKSRAYWAYDMLPANVKKELPTVKPEDFLRWTVAECDTFRDRCEDLLRKYNKRQGVAGDAKYEVFMENANNLHSAMNYIEKELGGTTP